MVVKQLLEIYEFLDRSDANGYLIKEYMQKIGASMTSVNTFQGKNGSTDFIQIKITGLNGKSQGGCAPTLGILGRLGGLGARPEMIGFVSDGDGALAALTVAAKLLDMQQKGDSLEGDVIIATHICPNAPTAPHKPVPFMGSPVNISDCNRYEVKDEMDAILSIDTTKGNRIINHRGIAISPTILQGYILKVSEDLLDIMQTTTGRLPVVFPVSVQDITPYGYGLYHLNSILQPAVATDKPVAGLAITAELPVAGCATGASHFQDIEEAARFALEIAKYYGKGTCKFYDEAEFELIKNRYGSLAHLQTAGAGPLNE